NFHIDLFFARTLYYFSHEEIQTTTRKSRGPVEHLQNDSRASFRGQTRAKMMDGIYSPKSNIIVHIRPGVSQRYCRFGPAALKKCVGAGACLCVSDHFFLIFAPLCIKAKYERTQSWRSSASGSNVVNPHSVSEP